MEEKKEVVEGKILEEKEKKKEDNAFSRFFKNTKKKLDDAALESKLERNFERDHQKFVVHTGATLLQATETVLYGGKCEDGRYLVWGDQSIAKDGLWEDPKTKEVRHITSITPSSIEVFLEGIAYQRPAQVIQLGDLAEKIEVVKVGDSYYRK